MLEDKLTTQELFEMNSCIPLVRNSQHKDSRKKEYIIPGMTEDPRVNFCMLRRWIIDFHHLNGMRLPTGFYNRNKIQLTGMFNGMQNQYGFNIEDITANGYR